MIACIESWLIASSSVPIRDEGSAAADLNGFVRSHRVLAVDRLAQMVQPQAASKSALEKISGELQVPTDPSQPRRVHVGVGVEHVRLEECVVGEVSSPGLIVKIVDRREVVPSKTDQVAPVDQPGGWEQLPRIDVDLPGAACLLEALEDSLGGVLPSELSRGTVQDEPRRGGGVDERTVAVGLRGNLAEPIIKDCEPPGPGRA